MANDVLVQVDQTGKPAKDGDGHICIAIDDQTCKRKWAGRVAYSVDPSEKQRKIPEGSRLWVAVMALHPRPPLFRNPISGVLFAWASNRQYWEADNNLNNTFTKQQWQDLCSTWTEGLKGRALALDRSGRLDLAFDETIEQSGLRSVLGKDESNTLDKVDTFLWGIEEKKHFLPLWMENIDWEAVHPPREPDGKPGKIKTKILVASLGLDSTTLDQVRNPSAIFNPRRNVAHDFKACTEKE